MEELQSTPSSAAGQLQDPELAEPSDSASPGENLITVTMEMEANHFSPLVTYVGVCCA